MQNVPTQMTVIGISKPGGPEVLVPETRPVPLPAPDQILVKVAAAGVNRPDVAQRSGAYPPPPGASDLPGLEIAGEVVAVGTGATKHKLGDKVMSLVAGGGYAQYCIAQDAQAITVPSTLSMQEAGAIPETLMTVWHNVFERGGLKAGETLLIHGGSSGIGTMAIQLAKAFGAKVIVNIAKVMMKRLTHTGSTLRPRTNADKAAMVAAIEAKVMPLIRDGRVKPLMDSTFPLEKAADAHRRMETSEHIGKIVLAV